MAAGYPRVSPAVRRIIKIRYQCTDSGNSAVAQELAQLLSEPLRPGFSQKYFTGGASGAAAMLPAAPQAANGVAAEAQQPGGSRRAISRT